MAADPDKFVLSENVTKAQVKKAVRSLAPAAAADQAGGDVKAVAKAVNDTERPETVKNPDTATGKTPDAATGQATDGVDSTGAVDPSKMYRVSEDGKLSFDPMKPVRGISQAMHDGVVDRQSAQDAVLIARKAQQQHDEIVELAGGSSEAKALIAGLPSGLSFWGGGVAAAMAGNASGANAAIAGLTGPFAPLTMGALNIGEGILGGTLAARATTKLQSKLAEYNGTLKSLEAASQLHPNYRLGGELIPQLPNLVKSIGGLVKLGTMAAQDLGAGASTAAKAVAASKAVGKTVTAGAVARGAQTLLPGAEGTRATGQTAARSGRAGTGSCHGRGVSLGEGGTQTRCPFDPGGGREGEGYRVVAARRLLT